MLCALFDMGDLEEQQHLNYVHLSYQLHGSTCIYVSLATANDKVHIL